MVTLEDIETELDSTKQTRMVDKILAKGKAAAMDNVIRKLKQQESLLGEHGPEIIKAMILGKRKLTEEEYSAMIKKFGTTGASKIEMMEHLNKAQKQYIFKRMGWDINEVE